MTLNKSIREEIIEYIRAEILVEQSEKEVRALSIHVRFV